MARFLVLGIGAALAVTASAEATLFHVRPLTIGDYKVSGTITTDGTTGLLAPSNFTSWDIRVVMRANLFRVTDGDSAATAEGVSVPPPGESLIVESSPDGVQEGGLLSFTRRCRLLICGVWVADFTGDAVSGGRQGFIANRGLFGFSSLEQPDGVPFTAAHSPDGETFVIRDRLLDGSPDSGLFVDGFVRTDGTHGPIDAGNINQWDLTIYEGSLDEFTELNSTLGGFLQDVSVSSDGLRMLVANPDDNDPDIDPSHTGGTLTFSKGLVGGRQHGLQLADFSDLNNQAGYFYGRLVFETISPLSSARNYVVASAEPFAVPAPAVTGMLGLGLLSLLARRARRT